MTFTPALAAASLYAGLNMLILLALTVAVIRQRQALKVAVGDGGHASLMRVMRGHANGAENAPVALLLLVLAALIGAPVAAVHGLGVMLTLGRGLHAWHFTHEGAPMWQRQWGALLTMIVQILAALGLIGHGLGAL
jgi:uncharacterized membrane protein YecN with MAPEG domain